MAMSTCRLIVSTLLILGCATSMRTFRFGESSPLIGKRIGVFYDRKIIGNFEGLDDRDSREYLTALAGALERYSENVAFLDMTRSGAVLSGYKPFTVKRAGFLGDTTLVEYLVPESGTLKEFEDSLDYVLVMQNLSTMVNMPVEIKEDFFPTSPDPMPGSGPRFHRFAVPKLRVVERDSQEIHHLGYILWDFKREELVGYDRNSLKKQDFMDRGTTFSQDAELTSQRVLKELQKIFRP